MDRWSYIGSSSELYRCIFGVIKVRRRSYKGASLELYRCIAGAIKVHGRSCIGVKLGLVGTSLVLKSNIVGKIRHLYLLYIYPQPSLFPLNF